MTKWHVWFLIGSGLLAAASAQADDFKCFVSGADGERYIIFNESADMREARSVAKGQKVQIGVERPVAVTRVFECAKLADRFLDNQANALDAETPR
jgi:hypothetical protein